ncbi:MAG TPA: bifunctional (p)ppGpp synthetase/guanosine-3',5'-bis(diphosphate) 3'-pyrophosphohydrolase [Prevotella sp.]|nr:bifunctional (p)ppGpp synthetase/guanosine-3',5'-bis(diphosphate) 3'-pyrophosphohydrolase [Candidatus Segatella violae]
MNTPLDTTLVDKAIVFATRAHQGTERRGKGFPYIVHPLEAMAIVATITNAPDLLAAAVLHDTVEDTDVTLDDLKQEFGEHIANLVADETDVKHTPDGKKLTWKERKQRDMDNLKAASREVKIVAIGDKLSNMRAIARDYRQKGDALWQIFRVKDKATHAWRYKGLRDALQELKDTFAFQEFDQLVEEIFGE